METKVSYTCKKCGWSGNSISALFPMHPSKEHGPRCPRCFNQLIKKSD